MVDLSSVRVTIKGEMEREVGISDIGRQMGSGDRGVPAEFLMEAMRILEIRPGPGSLPVIRHLLETLENYPRIPSRG